MKPREAKFAGMGEDGRGVALDVLVEPDAGLSLGQRQDASAALRTSSGSRRRSSPLSSIRSRA
jgi:hypothetical protein